MTGCRSLLVLFLVFIKWLVFVLILGYFLQPSFQAMTNLITGGPSGYCSCTEDRRHFAMRSMLPYLPAASSPGRAEVSPQRRTQRGRCLWHIQQEAAKPRQDQSSRTGSSGSLLQQDKQTENLHHEFGVTFIELSSRGPLKLRSLWSRFYTRFPNSLFWHLGAGEKAAAKRPSDASRRILGRRHKYLSWDNSSELYISFQ